MKIVRLTTLHGYGGQEKKLINFTEIPELLNNEYIFAAIGHGGYAERVLKERGFKVKIFNLPVAHKNFLNIFKIARWLKEEKPDVVHTAASEANFHGVLAAKLAGVPYIIAEQIGVPNTHSKTAQIIFRFVYKFADRVIAVSEEVKRVLILQKEVPDNKIVVLYNLVPFTHNIKKRKNTKFKWVFVSRLIARKNASTLIRAFSKLDKTKRGNLDIVGDGPELNNLKKLSKDLGLTNEIKFHGFQPNPEEYISKGDVFVLPAFDEGFGIVVIEAMSLKVPCLCGFGGGIPEYITHNENGWFFDPYSVEDLVEKMNFLLNQDPTYLENIGEKAYESVINRFSIKNYVKNLENIYSKIS